MNDVVETGINLLKESVEVKLKKEIRKIINKKGNLYAFLNLKKKEFGELPAELLTYDLLHKLWLQENRVDSMIGELFGKSRRQISKVRTKLNLTMKSESYYLYMYDELLKDPKGIAKATGRKDKLSKKEKTKLKSEFLNTMMS
jgi:anaerobic ribonucleoside-triphosphate reductase